MEIYATLTTQGTAMAETALCKSHFTLPHIVDGIKRAELAEDYDHTLYHNCTGNEALACFECEDVNDPEYV